jgi:hypothetical protein
MNRRIAFGSHNLPPKRNRLKDEKATQKALPHPVSPPIFICKSVNYTARSGICQGENENSLPFGRLFRLNGAEVAYLTSMSFRVVEYLPASNLK